jgi:tetratricopeptide (TPR) repeat protein
LKELADVNRSLGHYKEGIDQAREALGIFERLGETAERASCLNSLAFLLNDDGQLDAAEEATLEAIKLLPEKGQGNQLYLSHYILGQIYRAKNRREKVIYHYELALGFASTFDWGPSLLAIHLDLAVLFLDEDEFDKAQVQAELVKSHTHDNPFALGLAVLLQATVWVRQRKLEDAVAEALHAQDIFEKLENQVYLEVSRTLLREIEEAMESIPPSGEPESNGERPETIVRLTSTNSPFKLLVNHQPPRRILFMIPTTHPNDHLVPEPCFFHPQFPHP